MAVKKSEKIEQLRSLAGEPEAQAEFAASLLSARNGLHTVQAALGVLIDRKHPPARDKLIALYEHYDAQNGMRDPGAYTRSAIVRVLRGIALPADLALFARAVATYEFPPPVFKEECALLRGAALLALTDLDDALGRLHAARLLIDEHTDPMSGEPALTAARLLVILGEEAPLYMVATQAVERYVPEVASECLRGLVTLPVELIPMLMQRYSEADNPLLLIGLFDLLLNHEEGPLELDFVADFLAAAPDLDAYRYLAMTLVAAGNQALLDLLLAAAQYEQRPEQAVVLIDALSVLAYRPEVEKTVEHLKRRV